MLDVPFYCKVIDLAKIEVECESVQQIVVLQKAWYKFSFDDAKENLIRVIIDGS
jgi:hypothetical protein